MYVVARVSVCVCALVRVRARVCACVRVRVTHRQLISRGRSILRVVWPRAPPCPCPTEVGFESANSTLQIIERSAIKTRIFETYVLCAFVRLRVFECV